MDIVIDKEQLSKSLKELAITEPNFVKALLLEIADQSSLKECRVWFAKNVVPIRDPAHKQSTSATMLT